MSLILTVEDVLDYLRTHKNSKNILEFISDVQDVEKDDDFYKALIHQALQMFPDLVADAYAATFPPDSEAFEELAKRSFVLKVLVQKEFDKLLPEILKCQTAVIALAKNKDIQMAVIEQDYPEKETQELIEILVRRYHKHDLDVRHFIIDILRDHEKALAPR